MVKNLNTIDRGTSIRVGAFSSAGENSIVLNASGSGFHPTGTNGFFVNPIASGGYTSNILAFGSDKQILETNVSVSNIQSQINSLGLQEVTDVNSTTTNNIGIKNTAPTHALVIGSPSNLYVNTVTQNIGFTNDIKVSTDNVNGHILIGLNNNTVPNATAINRIAIGKAAGSQSQNTQAIAIGTYAGFEYQNNNAVAIGTNAGQLSQNTNAIAIGTNSGFEYQNTRAIAIGFEAGRLSQNTEAIAIGFGAGYQSQNVQAIAIGLDAGRLSQNTQAIAIGTKAGDEYQSRLALAIGTFAGRLTQNINAIAIGTYAGYK